MSGTVSTESLMRFVQATPQQRAVIDLFLRSGGGELGPGGLGAPGEAGTQSPESPKSELGALVERLQRIERKLDALAAAAGGRTEVVKPVSEGEAQRVFRLFGELLSMGVDLAAPPARVFDLMVMKKLSRAETAVECKCSASLITKRVAEIEAHFGMPMERLRDFASDLKERQRTVKGDRYAKKEHGAAREEEEPGDDADSVEGSLGEDQAGYLPEERQGEGDS